MIDQKELPSGWSWCTLGEVIETMTNGTTAEQNSDGVGIPVSRIETISESRIDYERVRYIANPSKDMLDKYSLRSGDILFSHINSASHLGKTALYSDDSRPLLHGMNLLLLRPFAESIEPKLLNYLCSYFRARGEFSRIAQHAVNQASINQQKLRSVTFPLPPYSEQHRIVAKIDELFSDLDAGVAALKRAKANLKRYRAAVLKEAVEGKLTEEWRAKHPDVETASVLLDRILKERRSRWEVEQLAGYEAKGKTPPKNWQEKYQEPVAPVVEDLPELPKGWCWATVEQITYYIRNGLSQKPSPVPPGHRILRINAVRSMSVDLNEVRFLDRKPSEVEGYFIENDDLLFTRYNGSVDLLGVAGMVRQCTEPTLHPDKLIRVRTVLGDVFPSFVEIASNVGESRKHMRGRARTTAGQTGISGSDVREMPIPLPPLHEQQEILQEVAARLSVADVSSTQMEINLVRSARLRQSILKRAFEGKLVPQDPNDESASVLLERIRVPLKGVKNGAATRNPQRMPRQSQLFEE